MFKRRIASRFLFQEHDLVVNASLTDGLRTVCALINRVHLTRPLELHIFVITVKPLKLCTQNVAVRINHYRKQKIAC